MLMRRDVLAVMQGGDTNSAVVNEKNLMQKKTETDQHRKVRAQRLNEQLSTMHEEKSIETIVDVHNKSTVQQTKRVQSDLKSQKDAVSHRLAARIR
jgi:NH3-dependent NAD+ synthetase